MQYSVTVYLIESCQFKASDKSINVWLVQGLILHDSEKLLAKKRMRSARDIQELIRICISLMLDT